jgi:ParB family protein of integrating conjugative element (PFGI_1 class)
MTKRATDRASSTPRSAPGNESTQRSDTPVALRLEVTRIKTYDRNPRRSENPEYDRIKASIRANGMDQPLVVTRRPDETDYVVGAGGNTRLQVLQALYRETGEERFYWVDCLFKPWHHESDVLLAHLRENDLRGSMTFIDKARAVFEAKQLLEEEMGLDELSQRRLETLLRDRGYSLSHGLISQMGYAVHTLLPVIPHALQSGLGRPQIERIRALDRAARGIWKKHNLGEDETFEPVFAALCQRYDGPEWDVELLRSAIETEIAEALDVSIHAIRVELDAQLKGHELSIPKPNGDQDAGTSNGELALSQPSPRKAKETISAPKTHEPCDDSAPEKAESEAPTAQPPLAPASSAPRGDEPENPPISTLESPAHVATGSIALSGDGRSNIKSLRARAWTLAARLAQRNGLGDLVMPLSGKGLGFILRDVPDPSLADQLDTDTLGQVSMLWWHLAACAEMTVAPLDAVIATLSGDSIFRRALENQDAGLLFNSVWTLDPGHAGYRLWRLLVDQDWQDLLGLMDTYRLIHRVAEDAGIQLWE